MRTVRTGVLGVVVLGLMGCGFGVAEPRGGNSGGLNITGTWRITETITQENCGEGTGSYTYNIGINQSGSNVTVTAFGESFGGTLTGNTLTWTGQFNEDGGVTTSALSITFSGSASFSGTSSWSWTDGAFTCNGQSLITGERL